MDFVKEIFDLTPETLNEVFQQNCCAFIKKKYFSIDSYWPLIEKYDKHTANRRDIILDFFGEEAMPIYDKMYEYAFYPEYPGLAKVSVMRDENDVRKGIVATSDDLLWHRDGPAFKHPYKFIFLHADHDTKNSVTHVLETMSIYNNLPKEDQLFLESLNYKFHAIKLKEVIQKEKKKLSYNEKGAIEFDKSVYPSILNFDVLLNFTDTFYEPLHIPLIQKACNGLNAIAYENSYQAVFEGKTFRETVKIKKWIDSFLYRKESIYSHHWDDGDILIFDAQCTLHSRDAYTNKNRLMNRLALNLGN